MIFKVHTIWLKLSIKKCDMKKGVVEIYIDVRYIYILHAFHFILRELNGAVQQQQHKIKIYI